MHVAGVIALSAPDFDWSVYITTQYLLALALRHVYQQC